MYSCLVKQLDAKGRYKRGKKYSNLRKRGVTDQGGCAQRPAYPMPADNWGQSCVINSETHPAQPCFSDFRPSEDSMRQDSEVLWSKPSRLSVRWSTKFTRRKRHHAQTPNSDAGSQSSAPIISSPLLAASSLSGAFEEHTGTYLSTKNTRLSPRGTLLSEHLNSIPEKSIGPTRQAPPQAISTVPHVGSKAPRVEFERRTSSLINLVLNEEDFFDFECEKQSRSPNALVACPNEVFSSLGEKQAHPSVSTSSLSSQASSEPSTQNTEPSPEPVKTEVRKIRSIPTWRSTQQIGCHRLNTSIATTEHSQAVLKTAQKSVRTKESPEFALGQEILEASIEQAKPVTVSPECFAQYRESMSRLDCSRRAQIKQLENRVKELESNTRNCTSNILHSKSPHFEVTRSETRIHGLHPLLPIART